MQLDLRAIRHRLFAAASGESTWEAALADLNRQVDGGGIVLLSTDQRFTQAPCSPELRETVEAYGHGGWWARDERFRGLPILLEHGIFSEFDFTTPEEMRRSAYYQDFLARHKRQWFAGVGFMAGSDLWCLSIQRTIAQGPFERSDMKRLKDLWQPFSDVATLSRIIGQARFSSLTWGLDLVRHPAIVCDAAGRISAVNQGARSLLGTSLGAIGSTLDFRDATSRDRYNTLLKTALSPDSPNTNATPLQTTVLAADRTRLLVRAIRMPDDKTEMFLGAAVLLLFKRIHRTLDEILSDTYHLTPAEIDVCKAIMDGLSVTDISNARGVKADTIRTQLKRIFPKTSTQRQSELALLMAKLARGDDHAEAEDL